MRCSPWTAIDIAFENAYGRVMDLKNRRQKRNRRGESTPTPIRTRTSISSASIESARFSAAEVANPRLDAGVERSGMVDIRQQLPVALEERALIEHGVEVRPAELIAGRARAEARLLLQPGPERGVGQRGQEPDHRRGDRQGRGEKPPAPPKATDPLHSHPRRNPPT